MKKILIANRGEIAVRIIKTCREMGIATVAVASEADLDAPHVREADEWALIGPALATDSYLSIPKIIEAAKSAGAQAIHPGFGFLSENAGFAKAVQGAGLIFIGPEPEAIETMGSKRRAKALMEAAGVPTVPGYHGADQNPKNLAAKAAEIGFPILIKASAGGGGKGMRVVEDAQRFPLELETAKSEARSAFGDDTVLLEKYLRKPRHIEFQIIGDRRGNHVHLFERECSIQRRHQKILEETPSTALDEPTRARMAEAALTAAKSVNYTNAGTIEFMLDEDGSFYFLEMNTRLQVEHPVTELLTGVDLVRWQILIAAGEAIPLRQNEITRRGHAIEVRIYAEDPRQSFFPQTGKIIRYKEPRGLGVRVDSGVGPGSEITIHYDPMIAKLIAYGATREEARQRLRNALDEYCIHGVKTNIPFLRQILQDPAFIAGDTTTAFLGGHAPSDARRDALMRQALALTMTAEPTRPGSGPEVAVVDPWDNLSGWRGRS